MLAESTWATRKVIQTIIHIFLFVCFLLIIDAKAMCGGSNMDLAPCEDMYKNMTGTQSPMVKS